MVWTSENEGAPRRVVVTKDLPGRRWREILIDGGCEIVVSASREVLTAAEISQAIGDRCDGAIGQLTETWGDELFEALRRAGGRVYSNYAVGYDNVDVAEATRRSIAVGNTPGVLTETTAEMAMALTFAAARRVCEAESFLRRGKFDGWLPDLFLGRRLYGTTLGIVGAGRIGTAFAKMLAPGLAMDVLYYSSRPSADLEDYFSALRELPGRQLTCRRVAGLDELLSACSVVSLHVPLTSETRHLMTGERLERMQEDAILVNTSRGPVVDEVALTEHLKRHPNFRAGLDVFENEPQLAPGLEELPNAVIVPHIASATNWTREGMASLAAANVAGVLRDRPLTSSLHVDEYIEGPLPASIPSIVNAEALGLPVRDGGQ